MNKLTLTKYPKKAAFPAFGEVAPHNVEIEAAVLGALLLEKDAIIDVIDVLKKNMFYSQANSEIYAAITSLFNDNKNVDLLTVAEALRKRGTLEKVGGCAYLAKVTHNIAGAGHLESYARLLCEYHLKRETAKITANLKSLALSDESDVYEVLETAQKEIMDLAQENFSEEAREVDGLMHESCAFLDDPTPPKGVKTGFRDLDKFLKMFGQGDLVIVAARPGMGKTSFALDIAKNAVLDEEKTVLFFSLEMTCKQVTDKLLSKNAEVEYDKFKTKTATNDEKLRIKMASKKFEGKKLFIQKPTQLTLFEIRAKARRLKAKQGLDMIVLDYLQLLYPEREDRYAQRDQQIANISKGLKALALELEVPIICAAQLNRKVEESSNKRPQLSHLRESGAVEQDADLVMMLYRDAYYGITSGPSGEDTEQVAEVIIAKNRNGGTGKVALHFEAQYTKFTNMPEPDTWVHPKPKQNKPPF